MKKTVLQIGILTTIITVIVVLGEDVWARNREAVIQSRLLAQEADWTNRPIRHFRNGTEFQKFVRRIPIRKGKMSDNDIWDRWQAALWGSVFDNTRLSIRILDWLDDQVQTVVDQDQIDLAKARAYFQQPDLNKTVEHYKKIPSESDYWLEAQEELAWTYLRLNQHNKTISALATVASPVFSNIIPAEPYFLKTLTHLQICDYPQVFKTTKLFKENFNKRIPSLQQLASQGTTVDAEKAVDQLAAAPFRLTSVGLQAPHLPTLFWRDQFFQRHILNWRQSKSPTFRARAVRRLQELAQRDLKEISAMVQKMHIVEAEAIQRLHMDVHLTDTHVQQENKKDNKDQLYFPYTSEVWLDELDSYQAKVKDCPTLRKASL
ncbi:MAG: hypothetical protein H6624_01960 [Bdellovibrionaceae bacterium]|nr:hypothetical protein [Bdellovibrionales bacterium]MCB9083074.1 hypothetical protein [Pseudobdellovibrionaceae bacterium]